MPERRLRDRTHTVYIKSGCIGIARGGRVYQHRQASAQRLMGYPAPTTQLTIQVRYYRTRYYTKSACITRLLNEPPRRQERQEEEDNRGYRGGFM